MSKRTDVPHTETKSFSNAPAVLNDAELDAVSGGGHSECESDDGRGTSSSKPPSRLLILITDGEP